MLKIVVRGANLTQLVSQPETTVEMAALEIARDAHPSLVVGNVLAKLDAMAEGTRVRVARSRSVAAQAGVLGTYLYDELGFRGNEDDYYDPRNSYFDSVIERRLGIPITLAVLVMAIARRVGLEVDGIGFPGHFLVRFGGESGILLDPFFRLRVVSRPSLRLLARRGGVPEADIDRHLERASVRSMTVRMLLNLKAVHEARRDHARAMVACDRLFDLDGHPQLLRDRGIHALALGARVAATHDLERYLALRPEASDRTQILSYLARVRAEGEVVLQ